MEVRIRKMTAIAVLSFFVIAGLILINGCKKSEPAASSTTEMSGNDMSSMPNMENHDAMVTNAEAQAAPNGQKICPVTGSPVNLNSFVEYQGKKVYFCCDDCKAAFQKDPNKYIAKLPQFSE